MDENSVERGKLLFVALGYICTPGRILGWEMFNSNYIWPAVTKWQPAIYVLRSVGHPLLIQECRWSEETCCRIPLWYHTEMKRSVKSFKFKYVFHLVSVANSALHDVNTVLCTVSEQECPGHWGSLVCRNVNLVSVLIPTDTNHASLGII